MSGSDDYYFRKKPHVWLERAQHLSLEASGAYDRYECKMYTRDGTVPSEATPEGMRWHQVTLGARDKRTVVRVIKELLEAGDLVRLADGRLTSKEVQKELAARARKKTARGGNDDQGGGAAGGSTPLFGVIPGGRPPPQPVRNRVGDHVEHLGMLREIIRNRRRDDRLAAVSGLKTQRNQRSGSLMYRESNNHEVVAAVPFAAARARGDPASPLGP